MHAGAQFTVDWRTGFVGIEILFCLGLVWKYPKSTPNARKECVCWAVMVALQWPLVIVFQRLMLIMGAGEESREVAGLLVHRDSLCLFDPGCELKMQRFHLCKAVLFPYSSKPSLFVGQQFTGVESQCLETTTSNSSTGRGDRFPLQEFIQLPKSRVTCTQFSTLCSYICPRSSRLCSS